MKSHESPLDEWLDRPEIRETLERVLEPEQRLALIKGLIPALVDSMGLHRVEDFLDDIRVKARRYIGAETQPGAGHAPRATAEEPIGGPTPEGHLHLDTPNAPDRKGAGTAERAPEAELRDDESGAAREDDGSLH